MSHLIRPVLAKPRLTLDEMCRLYGKFASYLRRVLCKTRLIFLRINGPTLIVTVLAWLPVVWHLDKDKQGALGLFITDEQLTKKQVLHNFS